MKKEIAQFYLKMICYFHIPGTMFSIYLIVTFLPLAEGGNRKNMPKGMPKGFRYDVLNLSNCFFLCVKRLIKKLKVSPIVF